MKKTNLLNQPLSAVIAGMGHTDTLCIGDCGLPIPEGPQRIDLALVKGIPTFLQTLDAVLGELCVEQVTIAYEMKTRNPALYEEIKKRFADITVTEVAHEQFKLNSAKCRAIVRTGEYMPYANIILRSGVTF